MKLRPFPFLLFFSWAIGVVWIPCAGCSCGDPGLTPENVDPVAQIISHRDRDPVQEGVPVDVVGNVSDTEDEALGLTVRWFLDDLEVCGPTPPETTGITSCTLTLSAAGDARVILEVIDRDGGIGRAAIWLFGVATAAPTVVIQRPTMGQVFAPGEPVDLSATVNDAEDGASALTVTWESSLEGALPALAGPDAGGEVTGRTVLGSGAHRLLVEVVDTTGKTGGDFVDVEVLAANLAPTCSLTAPVGGTVGPAGAGVLLVGTATDADDGAGSLVVTFRSDLEGVLGTVTPTTAGDVSLNVSSLGGGTHTLRMEARDPDGATCSDQVLYTATLPPTVLIVAPAAGNYLEGTALDLDAQVSDDRDAPGALSLAWSSDLTGPLGTPTADGTGFARVPGVLLALGSHRLSLDVVDSDAQQATAVVDVSVTVVPDDPPSAPVIHLEPLPADETDTLTVVIDTPGIDPEGAGVTHRYAWTVGGAPTGEIGSTIAPALTSVGEVWQVSVWASDGGQEGLPATAQATIASSADLPPSIPTIHLQPLPTHDSDDLVLVIDTPGVDPEGQGVTHRYAWTVDTAASGETGAGIAASLTSVGEVWEVSVFASDGNSEGPPATAQTTIVDDPAGPPACSLPATYRRNTHLQGPVDLQRVAWAPDGSYALILGYPRGLYRFDPLRRLDTDGGVDLIDAGTGTERWQALFFEEGGAFALVGGDDGTTTFAPLLYRYDDGLGLTAITDITGVALGKLIPNSRIVDLVQRPGTDTFTLLTDNGSGSPGIAYLHQVVFDWAGGAHAWSYEGGLSISQGASSIDWGSKLGQPMALAVSRYLEVMQYEPLLASANFHLEAGTPNHGNLKRVVFDPVSRTVAWVLQWSGQGRVYSWEDQLYPSTESFGFTGWSMYDFAVREDGGWKIFVGRNGNIWFSDSPFRPIDPTRFTNAPLINFDQPPWSGGTSDYLHSAAFRPGTCEGLVVGDATAGQGLIVDFEMITN